MNSDDFTNEKTTPWKRRDMLPSAKNYIVIINTVLTVVLSAVAPLGNLFSMFLFLSAATVPFAVNLLSKRSPLVMTAIPLSYVVSLIICKDPVSALLSLIYVPFAMLIAASLYSKPSCSQTVISYTAVSAALKIILFSVALSLTYGSVSDGIKEFTAELQNATDAFIAELAQSGVFGDIALPASLSSEMVRMVISLSPGILVIMSETEAYAVVRLSWRYLKRLRIAPALREDNWIITVGRPVGIIFAVSYVLSFIFSVSSSSSMLSYASINLSLITLPPIFLMGLRTVKGKMKNLTTAARFGIPVAVIALALFVPAIMTVGVMLICFVGTLASIRKQTDKNDKNDKNDL